ncbi:MAG TPA: endonuclease/exonuclease/phosphatase family protein [Cytophagales bacterium]|nr:endonuclease/exonuclease/phosphatase family protein [Cytophagales bacterium]
MYKILFLFLVMAAFSLKETNAQSLRIATYNVRYDNPQDSLDSWKYRLNPMKDLILYHDFDIFSTQEGLHHQLVDLEEKLQKFAYYGVGRNDGKEDGEFAAIFYKKDKFQVLKKGTFWLSETPDKPSRGWDAALPRVCTWIELKDASGKNFFVFNAHFDHKGVQARKESIKLVLAKIKEIAGKTPVILTGDFNFNQKDDNYALVLDSNYLKDAYQLASIRYAPTGTFNGFNINTKGEDRIDHIFVSPHFIVKKYGILTDSYQGRFPSDHFPVVVDLVYKSN